MRECRDSLTPLRNAGMHMQVQGMQGGYGAPPNALGKKYGALNMNIGIGSTKSFAGLSVGPAGKGGADDKGSKYTSPYSQKYISNQRMTDPDA